MISVNISSPLSGEVHAGIDPSLLTNAAFELVQASQALQAVQAVQPLLSSESPPMMTPLTQVRRGLETVEDCSDNIIPTLRILLSCPAWTPPPSQPRFSTVPSPWTRRYR